jgi:hypothetical protein
MRADRVTTLVIGTLLLSSSALSPSWAAPKLGEAVSVAACARAGVESSCLMITGADGTVFNITAANPKPPLDVMIQLRGTVSDKLSACNQGTVLDAISWTATQQKCPN